MTELTGICFIGCCYRDVTYSHNALNLINWFENNKNIKFYFITSNCGCFSNSQHFIVRRNELLVTNCNTVTIPSISARQGSNRKILLIFKTLKKIFFELMRGSFFFWKAKQYKIIHFDQVLQSFGSLSFITLLVLSKLFKKKLILTVHKIDPMQKYFTKCSFFYNLVNKITVFSVTLKDELLKLGIKDEKLKVLPFAIPLKKLNNFKRDQYIYFAGHDIYKGGNFEILIKTIKTLHNKNINIRLVIYTTKECLGIERAKQKIFDYKLENFIKWKSVSHLYGDTVIKEYQKSKGCLILYTSDGDTGIYSALLAMANGTPIISTRKAYIPEYAGELGIYLSEITVKELEGAISFLESNQKIVRSIGRKLRQKAEHTYKNDIIYEEYFNTYKEVMK